MGTLFVVTGPSGAGKSTLIRRVRRSLPGLAFSVSHTTRAPRPSERDGREYHFVPVPTFERMVREGKFIEWARVHGHLYGTSRAEIERKGRRGDVLLDIDVQGARQVRDRVPGAVLVFIMPPSAGELRRRLERRREDSPEVVARRLRDARTEVRAYQDFDYVVINDDLDRATADLRAVLRAARLRASAAADIVAPVLRSFGLPRPSRRSRPRSRP